MQLDWIDIESSHLEAIAHDGDLDILYIRFHNGDIYKYHPVSAIVFIELLNSASKGKFFVQNIKNNPDLSVEKQ
jgi:phosphomannomutase